MDFKTFIKNNHPDPDSLLYPNFDQLCKMAEDYNNFIQLMQTAVVGQSEQFYCLNRSVFGDSRKCDKQCLSCENNIPKQ